jgi:hypothetical protein
VYEGRPRSVGASAAGPRALSAALAAASETHAHGKTAIIEAVMETAYRTGACNIGPAEIARRRRSAIGLTLVTILVAGVLVASDLPAFGRVLAFPFAAAAAVTSLQAIRRFCVAFGALGIRNFGALGATESVPDAAARVADRRTALRMILEGSLYGLIATAALVALPI